MTANEVLQKGDSTGGHPIPLKKSAARVVRNISWFIYCWYPPTFSRVACLHPPKVGGKDWKGCTYMPEGKYLGSVEFDYWAICRDRRWHDHIKQASNISVMTAALQRAKAKDRRNRTS